MLSADDRRAIAARASTIYERTGRLNTSESPSPIDSDASAVLAAWQQAFAPGDPDALSRRLAWDGLTPDLVRAAAALDERGEPPAWTEWLARFERHVTGPVLRDTKNRARPRDMSVPFADVWAPVVDAAREALAARVGSPDDALVDLEHQLFRELSTYGELALDDLFGAHLRARGIDRAACSPESSEQYHAFIDHVLDDRLAGIWRTYPVLARQTAIVVEGWVSSTAEFIMRLAADRPLIAEALNDGVDPGPATRIEPGLSDPHEGRRRVAIVRFADGLRVVYKPRDLGVDRAYAGLCTWLAARGCDPPLPALRVVARDGYGWVEFAKQEPFQDEAAVRRYFRQAGALIATAHLLGSRDLHMENVVATAAGPVLIDLELLLQPERHAAGVDVDQSCLRTGLLSDVSFDTRDTPFDVGGLRGSGTVPMAIARRVWRHLGSDAMTFGEQPTVAAPVKNSVVLNGQPQSPDAFATEILEGFTHAYDFALAHRQIMIGPEGPLAAFGDVSLRIIVRPTNQYALLSVVRSAPRYQSDGLVRSVLVDALHRTLAGAAERPREWVIVVEERRAIEELDVPRFLVRGAGRSVSAAGRTLLDDYFTRSARQGVDDRLRGLSEEDRDTQRRRLSRALSDSTASRFATACPAGADDFTAHAEWIARELLARGTSSDGRLVWTDAPLDRGDTHFLYDGTIGAALFFAALARTTGDARWRRAATAAITPALDWVDSRDASIPSAIGGCSGLGSIAYGLGAVAALLGEEQAFMAATRVARRIDADRVRADQRFDVVEGAAGAILALLALHARTGDRALVDIARLCGGHLIESHRDEESGWSWPSADGRRFLGFAHGAAGIATALLRLSEATGEGAYRDAAVQALAFASRFFSPFDANWPAAAPDPADIATVIIRMTTWCHGAPGMALAAVDAGRLDNSPELAILTQARTALSRLPAWVSHHADHLCCGHMGRADVWLTAATHLGLPNGADAARETGRRVVARARRVQHFRLSTAGVEYRVFDAGLFRGLSGIGYELLRVERPDDIPSVLSFA